MNLFFPMFDYINHELLWHWFNCERIGIKCRENNERIKKMKKGREMGSTSKRSKLVNVDRHLTKTTEAVIGKRSMTLSAIYTMLLMTSMTG